MPQKVGYKFVTVNSSKKEEIPDDWSIVSLGDLCCIREEASISSNLYVGLENVGQGNNRLASRANVKDFISTKNVFLKGDILYGKLRPLLNKVWLATENGYCSTDLLPLVPNSKILGTILAYIISSQKFVWYAFATSAGTKMPRTNWSDISKFRLLLPSLLEQQKIASVLSNVDYLIQVTDGIIEQTQRLKKGVTQRLLTKGIAHTRFKKTILGNMPNSWDVKQIKDLASVKGGRRLPAGHDFAKEKTSYPYIRIVDLRDSSVDLSNLKYISENSHSKIANYTISSNDAYISIAGSVGIAGLIPDQLNGAHFTENFAKLTNMKNIEKQFLAFALNSFIVQKQIDSYVGKVSQPKLAIFRVEKLWIPVPPSEEQKRIALILSDIDISIQNAQKRKTILKKLNNGLMQKLLTGQIRVKV